MSKASVNNKGIGEEAEMNPVQKDAGINSQYLFIIQYNYFHHVTGILESIYTIFLSSITKKYGQRGEGTRDQEKLIISLS